MTTQISAYLQFLDSAKPDIPCYDKNAAGNSPAYHTGKPCISCKNPAGTWWDKDRCFECNVARLRLIDGSRVNA